MFSIDVWIQKTPAHVRDRQRPPCKAQKFAEDRFGDSGFVQQYLSTILKLQDIVK